MADFATATLSACSLGGYLPTGYAGTDWPDEFQWWEADGYLGDPLIAGGEMTLLGSVVRVPVALSPMVKSAAVAACYLDDYYYRIHVIPRTLDLGQLLSAETRDVTVWNAFFEPKTLASVVKDNAEGIVVPAPVTTPYAMAPLEEITYSIEIGISGPVTIDATVTFTFTGLYAPTVSIVGCRVVVWAWPPEGDYEERLQWLTGVIQTRRGEQRVAYRDLPRRIYRYDFIRPEDEMPAVRIYADNWCFRVWGLPCWKDFTVVSALSGATAINFDTALADYQEGGWAVLWESADQVAAMTITAVRPDGIDILLPLARDWVSARIMPMVRAITPEGFSFKRGPERWVPFSAEFVCTDDPSPPAASVYPQYRGYDVLTDGDIVIGDMSERISRPVTLVDNGQGPIVVETGQDYTRFARTVGKTVASPADLWSWRNWLYARKGKQQPFWLPTWSADLVLTVEATPYAAEMQIRFCALSRHGQLPKDFMLRLKSGAVYYRRINSAVALAGGDEMITIDEALGVTIQPSDIETWSFMDLVRLNSDEVSIGHRDPYRAGTSVPVMRVPE